MQIDGVDVDGDGDLDVTANTGFFLRVSRNNGNDSYGAPYIAADFQDGFSTNYAFGDFNEDGVLDLLADTAAQGYPTISFGTGNGFFGPPNSVPTGRDVQAMDVGDLDNDGNLDFASFYNLDEMGLGVRRGRGDGNFFLATKYPGAYHWGDHTSTLDLADFDGDAVLDAITTSFGAQDFSFWKGRGDGTFDDDVRYGVGWATYDIEPGDFDGDGILDVAVICQVDNGRWFYPGVVIIKGQGEPTGETAVLTNVQIVTGALLGGGVPDLIVSDDAYLHTRSGFGQSFIDLHHMELHVSAATALDSPSSIGLTIEDRIDEPAGTAQVRLMNWSNGAFDLVGTHAVGTSDAVHVIQDIDATTYVDDQGGIDVSLKHIVFVPFVAFTFESWIDWLEITVR